MFSKGNRNQSSLSIILSHPSLYSTSLNIYGRAVHSLWWWIHASQRSCIVVSRWAQPWVIITHVCHETMWLQCFLASWSIRTGWDFRDPLVQVHLIVVGEAEAQRAEWLGPHGESQQSCPEAPVSTIFSDGLCSTELEANELNRSDFCPSGFTVSDRQTVGRIIIICMSEPSYMYNKPASEWRRWWLRMG